MRSLIKIYLTLVLLVLIAPTNPVHAAVLEVRSPSGGIGALGDVYTNIQDAIDAASPGDTLVIHAGLYTENIDINKWLILEGDGNGNNPASDTIITAAVADHPTVQIQASGASDTQRLIVRNLRVTGATGSGNPGSGIELDTGSSYVTIESVTVTGNSVHGLNADVMGLIENLQVIDCNLSGNGGAGLNQNSYVSIDGLAIVDCNVNNNANGLYLEGPLTGLTLSGGSFNNNIGSGTNGVGIYGTQINNFAVQKPVSLSGFTANGNKRGLILNKFFGPFSVSNAVISDNTEEGIAVAPGASVSDLISFTNVTAENNPKWNLWFISYLGYAITNVTLENVTATGSTGVGNGYGIYLYASTNSTLSNVTVTNCTMSGNNTGLYLRAFNATSTLSNINVSGSEVVSNVTNGVLITDNAAAGNTINNSHIAGNGFGVGNLDPDDIFDATLNCWTDATGPYHPVKNPGGLGDQISDNVTYYPWYIDCTMTTPVSKRVHNITIDAHYVDIQPAIDEANPGDIIVADPGIYHENLAAWKDMEITKSLTLRGAGSGSTIVELSEGNGLGGKMNGVEIRGSNLDVTIEGITFTKTPGNTYATSYPLRIAETASSFNSLTLRDVEVGFAEASDVILGSNGTFTNVTVEDCNFHHAGTWGFLGSGVINGMVVADSNFVHNGQVDPGHGVGFDLTGTSSTNVSVTGGSFSNNKQAGINLMRISNSSFTGCLANNNAGAGGGGFGIKLDEWGGKSQNITFEQCTATGNALDGITIQPEKDDAIENILVNGCILTGNGRNGVNLCYIYSGSNNPEMTDITIRCCNLSGNGGKGVDVYSWWVSMTITETFDARYNWWGDPSGPSGAGGGSGAAVSEHVDFFPWLASASCEDVILIAADFVVDDNWVGLPDWTTVTVDSVDYYIGFNAFDVIQDAINAASDGNSIKVLPGLYDENLTIDKNALMIQSADGSAVDGTDDTIIQLSACSVKPGGVAVTGNCNTLMGFKIIDVTSYGDPHSHSHYPVYVQGDRNKILSNLIIGRGEPFSEADSGICIRDDRYPATDGIALGNVIKRNEVMGFRVAINAVTTNSTRTAEGTIIQDNYVHDNVVGIGARIVSGVPSPCCVVTLNNIVGNSYAGIEALHREYIGTVPKCDYLDAEYNWWGDASGPSGEGSGSGDVVSGSVDYNPWLCAHICNSGSPCPAGDLDGDCDVDFVDLAIFASNWLVGTQD